MEVHVISKTNISEHAAFTIEASGAKLGESSVRIRPLFLSLMSSQLSYASLGSLFHWWDTYPLPANVPAPYNDSSSWGIVPAWGYALVVESTTSILPGTLLFGYWPTTSVPTDLKLKPTEPKGQWIEISEHRQQLMTLYNRYSEEPRSPVSPTSPQFSDEEVQELGWSALFRLIWQAGYLLAEYVFPPKPQSNPAIHPLGMNLPWSASDEDVTSAIMVSLSASGKTARSFAWNFVQRPKSSSPLGFLQISSSPDSIATATETSNPPFPTKSIGYSNIAASASWITDLKPSKIVILDFGGRGNSLDELLASIKSELALESVKIVIIAIGTEQKVYTKEESLEALQAIAKLGKIQFNTSGVRDTAMEREGTAAYFEKVALLQSQWNTDVPKFVKDMKLVWGKGVKGEDGIEGGYERLVRGEVAPHEGLVYRL
ncbi:hypothetical protein B7494_g4021 [Chlorociboria aeruginascens]|nr:hypothetical protein B7494_g4021 [Chlorociboria aeruginascens]